MKNKTLLEQAKEVSGIRKSRQPYTDEHIELAIAWGRDEVTEEPRKSVQLYSNCFQRRDQKG